MKKKVFSAALVLSLALTGSAMADPALTQVSEVSDVEWIDGTNLFRAQDEEGYYMADIDGNAVSKSGYASSFGSSNGFITAYSMAVEGANAEGLLAPDGTEVIECKYGDIKVPNEHWAAAFVLTPADANNYDYQALLAGDGDKYYLIETVDFYHLADGKATLTGSFPRENCLDYDAQGDYLSVEDRTTNKVTMYDGSWNVVAEDLSSVYTEPDGIPVSGYEIYSENGQQGVKDADGNVLIEPAYKYVYDVENGYVRVSTGDLYGLLDLNGNVIVPAEADEIARCYYVPSNEGDSSYVSAGYAAAFVGGILDIRPVLHVDDEGHLINMSKVRGRRKSIMALAEKYDALALDKAGGTVFISHADCEEDAKTLAAILKRRYGQDVDLITEIGPVIGAHSGPGTLALFFLGEKR